MSQLDEEINAANRKEIRRRVAAMVFDLEHILSSDMGFFTLSETKRLNTAFEKLALWVHTTKGTEQ